MDKLNVLVITLTMKKQQLEETRTEHYKELFSEDYEGDWGEGNEFLGRLDGKIELIDEILELIS